MAEKNVTPVTPQAVAQVVTQQPAPAPVESASPAPTASPAPAADIQVTILGADAPVESVSQEAPKVEAKVEVKADAPVEPAKDSQPADKTVQAEKKTADGAEKTTQPEAQKKEEGSQSDEPAPLPSFDAWVFPENVIVDQTRVGEFTKQLGEFALEAKLDPKVLQTFGQKLIDRHVAEVQTVAQKVAEDYDKIWKDQTKSWYDAFTKDPEIGGKRQDTTVNAAREFIRRHGGTDEQQTEIRTLMQKTGLGNHPALIRLFAKATIAMREPKAVPAQAPPVQQNKSRTQKYYGKKTS